MKTALLCVKGNTGKEIARKLRDILKSGDMTASAGEGGLTLSLVACGFDDLSSKIDRAIESLELNHPLQSPDGIYFDPEPCGPGGLVFLYPGQGSQYFGMLKPLMDVLPGFRKEVERLNETWKALGKTDIVALYHGESRDRAAEIDTRNAQPALGIFSGALSDSLRELNIRPAFVAGHSYGEIPALRTAGAFNSTTFLRVSKERGRLLGEAGDRVPGAMIAVALSAEEVAGLLNEETLSLEIANFNAPAQTVVSGERPSVEKLEKMCRERNIQAAILKTSCAFHSSLMSSVEKEWRRFLASLASGDEGFTGPRNRTIMSNVTAGFYPAEKQSVVDLLSRQISSPVRWVEIIEGLHDAGGRIFLEVGPRTVLTGLAKRILRSRPCLLLSTDCMDSEPQGHLMHLLARLASQGIPVSWESFFDKSVLRGKRTAESPSTGTRVPAGAEESTNRESSPTGDTAPSFPYGEFFESNRQALQEYFRLQENLLSSRPDVFAGPGEGDMIKSFLTRNNEVFARFLEAQDAGLRRHLGLPVTSPSVMPIVSPSTPGQARGRDPLEEMTAWLIRHISEVTGFPESSINADTVFELDLGLDSITMMQILMKMIREYPDVEKLGDALRTVKSIADLRTLITSSGLISAAGDLSLATDDRNAGRTGPETVIEYLKKEISDTTGFPADTIGPDTVFELDLGLDSITMMQILMRVIRRFPPIETLGDELRKVRSLSGLERLITEKGLQFDTDTRSGTVTVETEKETSTPAGKSELPAASADGMSQLTPFRYWWDVKPWLLERLDYYSGRKDGPDSEDSGIWERPGLNNFIREKLIRDLLRRMPSLRVAERELLNAGNLKKLKSLINGITLPEGNLEGALRFIPCDEDVINVPDVKEIMPERILIIGSPGDFFDYISEGLVRKGIELITMYSLDECWEVEKKGKPVAISHEDGTGLAGFLGSIQKGRDFPPLVFLASEDRDFFHRGTFSEWASRLERGTTGLFRILKTIVADSRPRIGGRLAVIGFSIDDPASRGSGGVAKSAARELPGLEVRNIWIENSEQMPSVDEILSAMMGDGSGDFIISAGGLRRRTLIRTGLPASEESSSALPIDRGSNVLITGGGDGISAEIGLLLAREFRCRIIALGRTVLDESDRYSGCDSDESLKKAIVDDMQKAGGNADMSRVRELFKKIRRQRAIRRTEERILKAGGTFKYYPVDVSDGEDLAGTIGIIKKNHGRINGLVHGAGITGDSPIGKKSVDDFRKVLNTKAHSAYHLYHALRDEPLCFTVMMSSLSSYSGTPGQTDYTAANEVLNSIAETWNRMAPYPVKTMLWSVWGETGLAGEGLLSHMERLGLDLIGTDEGLSLFLRELRYGIKDEGTVLFSPLSTLHYVDGYGS